MVDTLILKTCGWLNVSDMWHVCFLLCVCIHCLSFSYLFVSYYATYYFCFSSDMANPYIKRSIKLLGYYLSQQRHHIKVFFRAFCCLYSTVLYVANTRNSSGDEIANVNFLYDDIVYVLQNTVNSWQIPPQIDAAVMCWNVCLPNSVK